MTAGNLIVGSIVLLIIAAAIYSLCRDRKKSPCGGCCSSCDFNKNGKCH